LVSRRLSPPASLSRLPPTTSKAKSILPDSRSRPSTALSTSQCRVTRRATQI
jgi:hypothetical protein